MDKKDLTIGMIITLVLAVSGTYVVLGDDQAYYCEDKDMVMICEKLSSGLGTRCYYDETYKVCSEGWEKIEFGIELNQAEIEYGKLTAKQYLCNQEECVPI